MYIPMTFYVHTASLQSVLYHALSNPPAPNANIMTMTKEAFLLGTLYPCMHAHRKDGDRERERGREGGGGERKGEGGRRGHCKVQVREVNTKFAHRSLTRS